MKKFYFLFLLLFVAGCTMKKFDYCPDMQTMDNNTNAKPKLMKHSQTLKNDIKYLQTSKGVEDFKKHNH